MSAHVEAFLAADDGVAVVERDDLIYKEVLREGEFRFTPTVDGVKPVPFRVIRTGPSSQRDRTISIQDVVDSFKNKAYEHVQVPLADKQNADHEDYARLNTGFVDELKVVDGDDGKARVVAGIRFTEPDVKEKVQRGTLANVSSGIWFDRVRPSDGAKFPAAMRHVCITNTPFQDNLKPFGVAMSEADGVDAPDESFSVVFADDEVVWSANESFQRLQENVSKAFRALAERLNPNGGTAVAGEDAPATTIFFPRDIWTTKILAENMDTSETFVVPFKRKRDSVELAPQDEWTRADQQWIAASEGTEMRSQGLAFARDLARELAPEEAEVEPPEEQTVRASEATAAPARRADTPQLRLRHAQEIRRARLRRPADKNARGGAQTMGATLSEVDLSSIELSDENRGTLQAVLDENARLREEGRTKAVADEVDRVMGLGLAENTGFVKTYRRLLLAADDGVAAVMLSEDGSKQEEITLTGALKLLIDALPKNTEGKIALSEQQLITDGGTPKPPAEAEDESDETDAEAIAATRKALGYTVKED